MEGTPDDPDPNKPFAKMENNPLFNNAGKISIIDVEQGGVNTIHKIEIKKACLPLFEPFNGVSLCTPLISIIIILNSLQRDS